MHDERGPIDAKGAAYVAYLRREVLEIGDAGAIARWVIADAMLVSTGRAELPEVEAVAQTVGRRMAEWRAKQSGKKPKPYPIHLFPSWFWAPDWLMVRLWPLYKQELQQLGFNLPGIGRAPDEELRLPMYDMARAVAGDIDMKSALAPAQVLATLVADYDWGGQPKGRIRRPDGSSTPWETFRGAVKNIRRDLEDNPDLALEAVLLDPLGSHRRREASRDNTNK